MNPINMKPVALLLFYSTAALVFDANPGARQIMLELKHTSSDVFLQDGTNA